MRSLVSVFVWGSLWFSPLTLANPDHYPNKLQLPIFDAHMPQSTAPFFSVFQDLYTKNLHVAGDAFFDGLIPGVASHVLLVSKGPRMGAQQFASIGEALASITETPSLSNTFVIQVGPGTFVEETIYAKPYVYIVGSGCNTTRIQAGSPDHDIIVAAPNSGIQGCGMFGATGPGATAIRFAGGGEYKVLLCGFSNCDTIISLTNEVAPDTFLRLKNCIVNQRAHFRKGIVVNASDDGYPLFVEITDLSWLSLGNPLLESFLDIQGSLAQVVISTMRLGNPAGVGGIGCTVRNGAMVGIQSSQLLGFADTAFKVTDEGAGPLVYLFSVVGLYNRQDLTIDHPATRGVVNSVFAREKVTVVPDAQLAMFLVDPDGHGTVTAGPLYAGKSIERISYVSPVFNEQASVGVLSGGELARDGQFSIRVQAGTGYVIVPDDGTEGNLHYIAWDEQVVPIEVNREGYLYIDKNGIARYSTSVSNMLETICLGRIRTSSSEIVLIQEIQQNACHVGSHIDQMLREALGPIYISGSVVTKYSDTQLAVSSGLYFYSTHKYQPSGGAPIDWVAFYRDESGTNFNIVAQAAIDAAHYDTGSGVLALIPENWYARHALFVVGQGVEERYLLVYGREVYDTLLAAEQGSIPPIPGTLDGNVALIASIIVKNSSVVSEQIAEILDERPRLGFRASGLSGVANHGDLLGLEQDTPIGKWGARADR